MYSILEFNHTQDYVKILNLTTNKVLQVSFQTADNLKAKGAFDEYKNLNQIHRTARSINPNISCSSNN